MSFILVTLATSKLLPSNLVNFPLELIHEPFIRSLPCPQVLDQSALIALTCLLSVLEKATVASCAVVLSLKIVCIKSLVTPTCLPDVLIPALAKSASLGTIM